MMPATTTTNTTNAAMPEAVAITEAEAVAAGGEVKKSKWAAGLLMLLGLVAGWEVRELMGEPVLTK